MIIYFIKFYYFLVTENFFYFFFLSYLIIFSFIVKLWFSSFNLFFTGENHSNSDIRPVLQRETVKNLGESGHMHMASCRSILKNVEYIPIFCLFLTSSLSSCMNRNNVCVAPFLFYKFIYFSLLIFLFPYTELAN